MFCLVPGDDRTWANMRIYVVLFSTSRQMLEQYLHYVITISFHIFSNASLQTLQIFPPNREPTRRTMQPRIY